jgi:hypothetical protein
MRKTTAATRARVAKVPIASESQPNMRAVTGRFCAVVKMGISIDANDEDEQ